jgi:large repetitive protein
MAFGDGIVAATALMAEAGGVQASSPNPGETQLTQAQLNSVVSAAIAQWAHAGASAAQLAKLSAITFTVADLAGNTIGDHNAGHIIIDTDAAGHGWFVDTTPSDNFEFAVAENAAGTDLSAAPSSAAAGHLDLLTAVMHEMGHELGLGHATDAHDLMHDDLVDGDRRLPTTADVAQADGTEIFSFTNVCTGTAGADNFVFTDFVAAAAASIPRVTDYNFAQGDTFDFSALTSQFHTSGVSDAMLVRAVADPSGNFATLQVNTAEYAPNMVANWTSIAQIDGAHAGDHVSVFVDSHNSVHHVDLLI